MEISNFYIQDKSKVNNIINKYMKLTEIERKVYFYLFIKGLDKLIEPNPTRELLAKRISETYCFGDKCKYNHNCCEYCLLHDYPELCKGRLKGNACRLGFCNDIYKNLSKKKNQILNMKSILKNQVTIIEIEEDNIKFPVLTKYIKD